MANQAYKRPLIPTAREIVYEPTLIRSRADERPRKAWLVVRWATPHGRRVDHVTVLEFPGRTVREVDARIADWIQEAGAQECGYDHPGHG